MTRRTAMPLLAAAALAWPAAATAAPAVSVEVTGPERVAPGREDVWTVRVLNTGAEAVPAAAVAVDVPALGLGGLPPDGDAAAAIPPGGAVTVTVRARVRAVTCAPGPALQVTATARVFDADATVLAVASASAASAVDRCTADVEVTLEAGAAETAPGAVVGWTATVRNTGTVGVPVDEVRPRSHLLAGLAPESAPADGWLDPGESAVYRDTLRMPAGGCAPITARVAVTPPAADGAAARGERVATRTVAVRCPAAAADTRARPAVCPAPRLVPGLTVRRVRGARRSVVTLGVWNDSRVPARGVVLRYAAPGAGARTVAVGRLGPGRARLVRLPAARVARGVHTVRVTARCGASGTLARRHGTTPLR